MNVTIPTYRLAVKMFAKSNSKGRETMVTYGDDPKPLRLADHIALVEKNGEAWIDNKVGYVLFGTMLLSLHRPTRPRWRAQMSGASAILRVFREKAHEAAKDN